MAITDAQYTTQTEDVKPVVRLMRFFYEKMTEQVLVCAIEK